MRKPKLKSSKKLVVGVTGSFGSGKSTVVKSFASLGAKIIDADLIAHKLLQKKQVRGKILAAFVGLKRQRRFNNRELAKFAFKNTKAVAKLNRILHPEILKGIKKRVGCFRRGMLVIDAPLLIETGLHKRVDAVVVVKAPLRLQFLRLKKRQGLTENEVRQRLRWQMPLKNKLRMADFVIDNSGSIQKTKKQVEKIVKKWSI